jgi:hypothetical protein
MALAAASSRASSALVTGPITTFQTKGSERRKISQVQTATPPYSGSRGLKPPPSEESAKVRKVCMVARRWG